jgi:GT2 family glycosyltransferase
VRVSVVVLSYNRPLLLAQALASIDRQELRAHEVVVVDNPSESSTVIAEIVAAAPFARLLAPERNLGFAGGMNAGLRAVTGDYVFLTEDDLVLDPACLGALAAAMEGRGEPALLAPIMLNRASGTVRCSGGRLRLRSTYRLDVHTAVPPAGEISFVPGAALFSSRSLWAESGGFRPDFFMYLEDCELCLRLARRGIRIGVVEGARVHHFEPPDVPAPDHLELQKQKNLLALYVLHASLPWLVAFGARYVLRTCTHANERRLRAAALRATAGQLMHLLRDRGRFRPAGLDPV